MKDRFGSNAAEDSLIIRGRVLLSLDQDDQAEKHFAMALKFSERPPSASVQLTEHIAKAVVRRSY